MKKILSIIIFTLTAQLSYCQYQTVTIAPLSTWEWQGGKFTNVKTVAFQYAFVHPISPKAFVFGGADLGANFQTTVTPNISIVAGVGEDLFTGIPALVGYGLYDGYSHDWGVGGGVNLFTTIFGASASSPTAREIQRHKYNALIN